MANMLIRLNKNREKANFSQKAVSVISTLITDF